VLCSSIQEEREERHKYKGAVKSVLDDGPSAVKTCKFNFWQLPHLWFIAVWHTFESFRVAP